MKGKRKEGSIKQRNYRTKTTLPINPLSPTPTMPSFLCILTGNGEENRRKQKKTKEKQLDSSPQC
jgi:hypothetical protein